MFWTFWAYGSYVVGTAFCLQYFVFRFAIKYYEFCALFRVALDFDILCMFGYDYWILYIFVSQYENSDENNKKNIRVINKFKYYFVKVI